jgi:hypothetical protein
MHPPLAINRTRLNKHTSINGACGNSLRTGVGTPLARGSQPAAGALVKLLEVKQRRSGI